jgi:hypothetical protein
MPGGTFRKKSASFHGQALHIALLTVYTSLKVVTPAFRSMPSVPINSLSKLN